MQKRKARRKRPVKRKQSSPLPIVTFVMLVATGLLVWGCYHRQSEGDTPDRTIIKVVDKQASQTTTPKPIPKEADQPVTSKVRHAAPVPLVILSKAFPSGQSCAEPLSYPETRYQTSGPYDLQLELEFTDLDTSKPWPGTRLVAMGTAGEVYLTPTGQVMIHRQPERRIAERWKPRAYSSEKLMDVAGADKKVKLQLVYTGSALKLLVNGKLWAEQSVRGTKSLGATTIGPFNGRLYRIELKAK